MNKQKKQTLIIAIVLAVLIGLYYLVPYLSRFEKTEEVEPTVYILENSYENVSYITFKGLEETLTFTKSEDSWTLEGYEDREVDATYVKYAVNSVINIPVEQSISDVEDYSQYGFENPTNTITYISDSGSHTVILGDYNIYSYCYYIMVDDDPTVYVYSHSSGMPTDYEAEHYLVALETKEEGDTTDGADVNSGSTDEVGDTDTAE